MEDKQIFIPKDSLVKVYFKNGTVIEGVVLTWNDKKGLLRSPGGSSRMIIYNPIENVMMVKLIISDQEVIEEVLHQKSISVEQAIPPMKSVPDDSPEISSGESIDERTEKLVKYRLSRALQEKQSIAESLRKSNISSGLSFSKQPPKVETSYYESPNFSKHRSVISTRKKDH
jgi:hypothetical protein